MPAHEIFVGSELLRQRDRLTFIRREILFEGCTGEVIAEAGAYQESPAFVEGNEAGVEGGVVGSREAQAVAGVDALIGVGAPGEDVAGDEEGADGVGGDAAAAAVGGEHGLAEEGLAQAHANRALLRFYET